MAIDIKSLNHAQLGDLIERAQARQAELRTESAHKVRAKIAALAKAEGLDIEDVLGTRKQGRGAPRGKVKPKYRNPADKSQVWSGRGRHPLWFDAAIKAGKTERSLLIK
ncbi:MAG TPA: H-NS histone family protein [Dokdonella sp.]